MKLKLALLAGLALAGANAMACYTVYDSNNRVIFQSVEAPVDMSQPLHNALARRFPAGASMVFNQGASCTPVSLAQVARPTGGPIPVNTIRMERGGKQMSPSSSSAPGIFMGLASKSGRWRYALPVRFCSICAKRSVVSFSILENCACTLRVITWCWTGRPSAAWNL